MYTGSVVPVDTEISDVMEGASIWIPERADPIYKFDEKESSCKDSEVLQALSFLNVTCPIKSGRKLRTKQMYAIISVSRRLNNVGDFHMFRVDAGL